MNVLVAHVGFDMPVNQRDLGESFEEWADIVVLFDDELGKYPSEGIFPVVTIVFSTWRIKNIAMPAFAEFLGNRKHEEFNDGFPAVRFFENGGDLVELARAIKTQKNFKLRTLKNVSTRWQGRI